VTTLTDAQQPTKTLPAGPKGSLLLGNLNDFRKDMTGFLERTAREHGDVVPLRFANMRFLLVAHPDAIEEVLVKQNKNFVKNVTEPVWWALLGNGLLLSEGDFWIRQRRLMQPAFHRQRIAEYGRTMVAFTQRALEDWKDGQSRDIHEDMMRLTLEVVAKTLFDADVADRAPEVGQALEVVLTSSAGRSSSPFRSQWRFPRRATFGSAAQSPGWTRSSTTSSGVVARPASLPAAVICYRSCFMPEARMAAA
jgi:cytochrome P450